MGLPVTIRSCVLFCLLTFFMLHSQAQVIQLKPKDEKYIIGKNLQYYEDTDNQFDIKNIASPAFQHKFIPCKQEQFNMGVSHSTFWIKFEVENTQPEINDWLLYISYGFVDYLGLYSQNPVTKEWEKIETGINYPYEKRQIKHHYFVFPLSLNKANPTTFYLKIQTTTPLQIPLIIQRKVHFDENSLYLEILYGVFIGILLLMIITSVFTGLYLNDPEYLYYVIFIIGSMIFYLGLSGHTFQFIWPNNPLLGKQILGSSIGIWIIGAALFTNSFLDTRLFFPNMHKVMKIYFWSGLIILPLPFIIDYTYYITIIVIQGNIGNFTILCTGVICWYRGNQYAKYFAIAWIFYFSGTSLLAMATMGILPNTFITAHLGEISAVFEIIMFSLALSHKYNFKQKELALEKQKAQMQIIQVQKEANEMLENKVLERTRQLQEKQEEIEVQNEELRQKQEELEIHKTQLSEYNENLEKMVNKRTNQLKQANLELINQNNQLEQFAFITAHNLRAPVAQLLGLTNIINSEDPTDPHNFEIIKRVKDSANRLNHIIKDLNEILEIRKGIAQITENLDLNVKLEEVKQSLADEIKENQAVITADFSQVSEMRFVNAYLKSILYNLISNAIKYRAFDKPPVINLKTCLENDNEICLIVSDNGLGIDLELSRGKLFGLYQRFHLHKEGKGLGLYLIKTQIEAMGGKIKIESIPDKGTTFYLYFKK